MPILGPKFAGSGNNLRSPSFSTADTLPSRWLRVGLMLRNISKYDVHRLREQWTEDLISRTENISGSAARGALDAITRAAIAHARASDSLPDCWVTENGDDLSAEIMDDLLRDGADVVFMIDESIEWSANKDGSTDALWHHRESIEVFDELRAKAAPRFNRFTIEEAVQVYLQLPYRSPVIDRILIDLLVSVELYAFADWVRRHRLRPLLTWLVDKVVTLFLWALIFLVLWGLSVVGLFHDDWLFPANLIIGVLVFVYFAFSTLMLPNSWWRGHKQNKKTADLMSNMVGVYSELSGEAISARHIEHRARSASDAGVVWPAPLFVLLEDIIKRDGVF